MYKKILFFSVILFISISLLNICCATDVLMDLDNSTINSIVPTANDNTTYASNISVDSTEQATYNDYEPVSITASTTDYEDSTNLSISNMINIILIVVGIVLILLGIAIIIKLK